MNTNQNEQIVVIGGGLAGLTAATCLARAGRAVLLLEKAHDMGGRAATQIKQDFAFNQGPHALYAGGPGVATLRELGIPFSGSKPNVNGYALLNNRLEELLTSPLSLLRSRLLSWSSKIEFVRLLNRITRLDPARYERVTVRAWVEEATSRPELHQVLYALIRLSTYAANREQQSAGAALAQVQLALKANVYYIDGGWQTLVDGLRQAATDAGVRILTNTGVQAINYDERVQGITLRNGSTHPAAAIVAAVAPNALRQMMVAGGRATLTGWLPDAPPIYAACLDVALRRLPRAEATFALGIDRPLYLSVHSTTARLAPDGGALVHVARYLTDKAEGTPDVEAELAAFLDKMQPGWRDDVVTSRFLPHIMVSNALVTAQQGGMAGRPGPQVPGIANLYVAGDWVGPQGMLADAAFASARQSAMLALGQKPQRMVRAA